jgi:hypothetical protein
VKTEISGSDDNVISPPLTTQKSWEQRTGKEKD